MVPVTPPSALLLDVEVRSPHQVLFQGQALAVSSRNSTGPFDILPAHANFISLIDRVVVIHLPSGQQQDIGVQNAVLHCRENRVQVFTEVGSLLARGPAGTAG